jgi:hypothetical protein
MRSAILLQVADGTAVSLSADAGARAGAPGRRPVPQDC